jgi:hypothetical protein
MIGMGKQRFLNFPHFRHSTPVDVRNECRLRVIPTWVIEPNTAS